MKKEEILVHQQQYQLLMDEARAAEREGLYRVAVEKALASWEHIDGMMQYERKYESKEFSSVRAIDLTLKYAPLLLDFASLDKLEGLLKDFRRIERNTSDSLADKLTSARKFMWNAHRLWDQLERNPGQRQDELRRLLGGEQEQWRGVAEAWEKMGLLQREPVSGTYRLTLSTRMGQLVSAKCPVCGEVGEGPKAMWLEKVACPECKSKVLFVILSTNPVGSGKG